MKENDMKRGIVWLIVLAFSGWAMAAPAEDAEEAEDDEALTPAEKVVLAKAVRPSLIRAEYTLQFDKGQAPEYFGQGYHGESVIRQERPVEMPGFLIAGRTAIIRDPMVHPRFVKDIAVTDGEQLVKAEIAGYGRDHTAVFLKLAKPLKKAKPLAFDAKAERPYFGISYSRHHGVWTLGVDSVPQTLAVSDKGREYRFSRHLLLVDGEGKAVGLPMNGYLQVDGSWKGSPAEWPKVSVKQMKALLAGTEGRAEKGVLRTKLNFRSPKKGAAGRYSFRHMQQEGSTESNVIGLLVKDTTLLVLAHLPPKVTARLERITVYPPKGDPVKAEFAHTLKDYGCFVATLAKPLVGALKLSGEDLLKLEDRLLPVADVRLHGEKRESYFCHRRIGSYSVGWKRQIYPQIHGPEGTVFVFDARGALLAFPLSRRQKVTVQDRWGGENVLMTAAHYVKDVLADLPEHVDPSNVPLTEEQENRLAWLGVVLQALDRELARVNKVSHLTNDGQFGALVSYVYPDSPAGKAGIQPGYVLIRLHVKGHPKPLQVRIEEYGFGGRAFPWDRMDEIPERFFDRIPTPWPPAENNFTRALTDLGFGEAYTAEFFHDGKIVRKDFTVTQSPPHYGTAARHKSKMLGMTVRDLSYEVRRYFQKKPSEPGVIVSKIEPGSKASVAGVKPYEIITHVNDKPVKTVKDFEKLLGAAGEELRLSVKRMTRGRIVKIKVDKDAGPEKAPATTRPSKAD